VWGNPTEEDPDREEQPMSESESRSIADNERSPATDAADEVEFGPSGTNEEDERRPEPPGTSEAAEPKTDADGNPVVPPSRHGAH